MINKNKIYELVASNRFITQNEIVDILGVNIRTVKRNFKALIDNNIIERIGSNKKGYWEILKDITICEENLTGQNIE